jgi:hypothetical protein
MSRFGDSDYDGEFKLELFRANVDRAIKGKRGQKALREMREALLALPEKKLVSGALCVVRRDDDDKPVAAEGFCAIGAFSFAKRLKAGEPMEKILDELAQNPDDDFENEFDTIDEGRRQGLVGVLAWELAWMNDEGLGQWKENLTDEERYSRYLAWVESQILPDQVPA